MELARPQNELLVALSVVVGAFLGRGIWSKQVLLASLSAAFIAAGGNAINDCYDVPIDRINKPHRPLPSGRVRLREGWWFSISLLFMGLALSPTLGLPGVIVASFTSVALFLYARTLKRMPIVGNLVVSLTGSLAFIYGGIAVDNAVPGLIPAGFSLLFHWGREILKDIEDCRGDLSQGAKTMPIVYGIKPALWAATVDFAGLICLTFLPYFLNIYSLAYLVIVVIGVDLYLVYVMVSMWRSSDPRSLGTLNVGLKVDMVVGLLAICLG